VAGLWGYEKGEGLFRYVLAFSIPLVLASLWGIFAVSGDPSRSGKTVVQTPGIIRLLLEFMIFSFSVWALYSLNYPRLSILFGITVILHYLFSYHRIIWLLKH